MKNNKISKHVFIHQNLQSIGNCLDIIEAFLETQNNCTVFCVTEHWKTSTQLCNYNIKGFSLVTAFCRKEENSHGGCAFYVFCEIECKIRTDELSMAVEGSFECCACEFQCNKKTFIIVCVYRPPIGDFSIFLSKLEEVCLNLSKINAVIFCIGDFNVDILSDSRQCRMLLSLMESYGIHCTFFQPTRELLIEALHALIIYLRIMKVITKLWS